MWRRFHQKQRQYTWVHNRDNLLSMASLDCLYCFKHHFSVFNDCFLSPVGFSDHSLVYCSVFIKCVKPHSAYWHFNTALLVDTKFRDAFKFFWNVHQHSKNGFTSLQQWWDLGKCKIKQFCQQYTQNVTRDIARSLKALEIDVVELQDLAESTGNRGHIEALKTKKSALANLLGISAQGALVRSWFRNISEMDALSHFFFGLECKNGQKRLIHSMRSDTGQVLSESTAIRKHAVGFYSSLFTSEIEEEQEVSHAFYEGLPKVEQESIAELEAAVSPGELYAALQSLENGKAPGIDGFPVEFYKCLWSVIGEDLLTVLSDSLA